MIKIGKHFFAKNDTDGQGFRVYDISEIVEEIDKEAEEENNQETEHIEETHTVFERVLERRCEPQNNTKLRYSVIFGVSFALIFILMILGSYFNIYKKNSPAEFCEQIASAYDSKTPDLFLENCTNLPEELKDKANLKKYFNNFLSSEKCEFYEVASKYNNSKKYIFKSGGKKIGEILFVKNKKPAAFGVDSYTIKSFKLYPLVEYRITAYSTYTLKINGKEINNKYLQGRNTAFAYFSFPAPQMVTQDVYIIDDLCFIEQITAVDIDGKSYEVFVGSSNMDIDVVINGDDKKEELYEFFDEFVYNYMYYIIENNQNPHVVLKDVYEGTNIYNSINKYYNENIAFYDTSEIEKLKVSEISYYGSGFYTCLVSAEYYAEAEEKTIAKKFSQEVSLLYNDGRYYVINMTDKTIN